MSTGYYTTGDEEYIYFRPLETTQQVAIDIILHESTGYNYGYSVFFSDVAKINFTDSAIDDADIVTATENILNPTGQYSVVFSDVTNIDFQQTTTDTGIITFGRMNGIFPVFSGVNDNNFNDLRIAA